MHINNQRGHLLLLTMVVLAVVSLSAFTGLYMTYNTRTDSLLIKERIQAYYIADAGIELALVKIKLDDDWSKWRPGTTKSLITDPEIFANGIIESLMVKTLSKTVTETEIKLNVEITAKGVCKQAQKTLIAVAQIERQENGQVRVKIISWKELYPVFV